MKPFDLKKALAGALVVTRDGCKVTGIGIAVNSAEPIYPVFGHIEGYMGQGNWTNEGGFLVGDEDDWDLFMAEDEPERPDSMSLIAGQMREIREGYVALVQLKDREIAHKDKIIEALIAELRRHGVEKFEHEGETVTLA